MNKHRISAGALGLATALTCAGSALASTGPSSSDAPYVVRSKPGVVTKSILTVGDSVGGYTMAGIPDGLGAYDNGDGTFTLLANHEFRPERGTVRDHGATGAFVSKWTIDKATLEVQSGQDLIQTLHTTSGSDQLNRLCSADLPDYSAFFDSATGTGYPGRIFMSGEETSGGRVFAHVATGSSAGNSYQVPALGGGEWENVVANPATGAKTVVAGTHDTGGGRVVLYEGNKSNSGTPVEQAGLAGGTLGAIRVAGVASESDSTPSQSGTAFSIASSVSDGTGFNRPEDAAWDPTNPNVLYFVTTGSFTGKSRLWRITFADVNNPSLGGTADTLLDGTEGQHMLDNLTVTNRGQLIIQEDPGGQNYLARIWRYYPATDKLVEIAHFDEDLFTPGKPGFITNDEESSGVIDVSDILGDGQLLADAQVHAPASDPDLGERGQFFALHVPAGQK